MMEIKPEAKAEIILWDWLKDYGEVYFNRKNVLGWKTFKVIGISKEIPDLLFVTEIFGRKEVIAIEVKDGDAGSNIRQANKIFKKYLLNQISGKTKYIIDNKKVIIDRFIVATQYSPKGHLFGYGDIIQSNGCAIKNDWINKIIQKLEFVRTKDFGRSIIQDYSMWRKKTKYKNGPALGWLISDILCIFTEEELKTHSGFIGKPIIQGVSWNAKLNRWGQFFIKIWKH